MMRNAVWALSNLCRGKNPPPDFAKVICQDKASLWQLPTSRYSIACLSRSQACYLSYLNCTSFFLTGFEHDVFSLRCPRVSACFPGCCLLTTRTSLLMHAGRSLTFLMAPMTRSRLLSTQESVEGLSNCWCKSLNMYSETMQTVLLICWRKIWLVYGLYANKQNSTLIIIW